MENIQYIILGFLCLLFIGLIGLFFYLIRNNNRDFLNFSKHISELLNDMTLANDIKLKNIKDEINLNLKNNSEITNETFLHINERMIRIDESQKNINELSKEIISLQSLLQDKKSRGTFGEIELYSLLDSAFGQSNLYYRQYLLSNSTRVDAAIIGPKDMGILCIDSKFPLENYRKIYDNQLTNNEKEVAKNNFKNDVIKHLNDIKNKYIIPGETANMAYMFVPSEAVFAEIYGNYPELIDKSYENNVYIVSPTTLMAYITAIKSIYLSYTKNEKAAEIEKLLNELSIEFLRFKERSETLQKDYSKIVPDFERLIITANKITKKFDSINNGDIEE